MHRAILVAGVATSVAACGYGYETSTTAITGAPMITTGPQAGQRELTRTLDAVSSRLAREVCARELRCDRRYDASSCESTTIAKAREQLARWDCSPAATRARVEECLAGIDETHCDVDLVSPGKSICPENLMCRRTAGTISPGRVHALVGADR